jgi:hypothetical protein
LDLALKLLKSVDYYTKYRTLEELKYLGNEIKQFNHNSFHNVIFSGFTEHGKSGDWIAVDFRFAMDMRRSIYKNNFRPLLQGLLEFQILKPEQQRRDPKLFVFLDDYIGTGRSVTRTWENIQGLTNDHDKYYLATVVATQRGLDKINKIAPDLKIFCRKTITDSQTIFHEQNNNFTAEEKQILLQYCKRASRKNPMGFGETQSLTIFYERVADNVLPVLFAKNKNWSPLFPRYFS